MRAVIVHCKHVFPLLQFQQEHSFPVSRERHNRPAQAGWGDIPIGNNDDFSMLANWTHRLRILPLLVRCVHPFLTGRIHVMPEQYQLLEDSQNNEWQLLRQGAGNIESIFLTLDDALKRLPDAVGNISTIVTIFDAQGSRLGQHVVGHSS